MEVLVGMLGALTVLTFAVTVWCEVTGRGAVIPALLLLALALLTWLAWRTWRRYRP